MHVTNYLTLVIFASNKINMKVYRIISSVSESEAFLSILSALLKVPPTLSTVRIMSEIIRLIVL